MHPAGWRGWDPFGPGETQNDGPRTTSGPPDWRPFRLERHLGVHPRLFNSGGMHTRAGLCSLLPLLFCGVVETRRLELLTLSLQRRCSAN